MSAPRAIAARDERTAAPDPGAPESEPRTPWLLAILCLLISVLPSYQVLPGPLKSNGSPAKIIAIVLAGLIVLGFLLLRRSSSKKALSVGAIPLLVYLLLTILYYGVGVSQPGKTFDQVLITEVANVGLALYAMTRVTTVRHRSLVLGFLCTGMVINCVLGILQATASVDISALLQPPGFVDNQVDLGRGLAATPTVRNGAVRAVGTSGHAIEFAVLAAIAVPLALHFARNGGRTAIRVAGSVAAVVALFAMASGGSRSGVVALGAAFLIYMWTLRAREVANALIMGIIAVVVGFMLAPGSIGALWQSITGSAEDGSVLERVEDYARVSETFRNHTWFGIGLGRSSPADYGFLDNQWLQQIVQGGVAGILAMIVLISGAMFGISAALRSARSPLERAQAYVVGAMMVGIVTSSVTFDLFAFQQVTLVFFILYGLLWANFAVPFVADPTELDALPR